MDWYKENIKAAVRVILKRSLRAVDYPFHGEEETDDLLSAAIESKAPVAEMGACFFYSALLKRNVPNRMKHVIYEAQYKATMATRSFVGKAS